jgi:ABC-type Fe3+ transport system permease subunit
MRVLIFYCVAGVALALILSAFDIPLGRWVLPIVILPLGVFAVTGCRWLVARALKPPKRP